VTWAAWRWLARFASHFEPGLVVSVVLGLNALTLALSLAFCIYGSIDLVIFATERSILQYHTTANTIFMILHLTP